MRCALPLGLIMACACGHALAQVTVYPPSAIDLPGYATTDAVAAAISAAMSAPNTKLAAVPSAGPGPGQCKISVVPSEVITSGGVIGTAGTCSRIVQCGTSATYTAVQFNLGSGC